MDYIAFALDMLCIKRKHLFRQWKWKYWWDSL